MQVNRMFKDLAVLVHEQVQMLDSIQHNVHQANNYLDKGEKNLKDAKASYESSRTVSLFSEIAVENVFFALVCDYYSSCCAGYGFQVITKGKSFQ